MTFGAALVLAAVTIGTWNGEWFPSGRAEHRAAPEIEAATIAAAGRLLREGLHEADPTGTNDVVLCLSEIRGPKEAEALCAAIGREDLKVVVVTRYRRRDRFDQQQEVILSTLPVVSATWSRWKDAKDLTPPRGYARAELLFSPSVTGTVYAVHLKSNYHQTTGPQVITNRAKRTLAVQQMIDQEKTARRKHFPPVVIAGDFNADKWGKEFAKEEIFVDLEAAHFINPLELLPPEKRVTYPGKGKWGNSALDYIFLRGLEPQGAPVIGSAAGVSDHNPLFVTISP